MGIGKNIKELADLAGINLRQLSIKAKVPYNTLYAIVRRDSNRVDLATIQAIADALDVPWFLIVGASDDSGGVKALYQLTELNDPVGVGHDGKISVVPFEHLQTDLESLKYWHAAPGDLEKAILERFDLLSRRGKMVAIERVEELAKIPEYKKEQPSAADSDET